MMPVLYTIGPFNVYSFGIFLALAFVFSTFIVWKFGREEMREEEYLDVFFYTSLVALISARTAYIAANFEEFGANILKYILIRTTPGLSLIGGLFGGALFLFYYAKKKKFSVIHLFDIFSVAAALALSFAKVGEQLGGAAFGKMTDSIIGIRIASLPDRYHPAELYEAVFYLGLFILLYIIYRKLQGSIWPKGLVACLFVFFTVTAIFTLEFFRRYHVYLWGLSLKQIASLIFMGFIIYPLVIRLRRLYQIVYRKKLQ